MRANELQVRACHVIMSHVARVGISVEGTITTWYSLCRNLQGSFEIDVETLEAEGHGCGIDYLDIQVISGRHVSHICMPQHPPAPNRIRTQMLIDICLGV